MKYTEHKVSSSVPGSIPHCGVCKHPFSSLHGRFNPAKLKLLPHQASSHYPTPARSLVYEWDCSRDHTYEWNAFGDWLTALSTTPLSLEAHVFTHSAASVCSCSVWWSSYVVAVFLCCSVEMLVLTMNGVRKGHLWAVIIAHDETIFLVRWRESSIDVFLLLKGMGN